MNLDVMPFHPTPGSKAPLTRQGTLPHVQIQVLFSRPRHRHHSKSFGNIFCLWSRISFHGGVYPKQCEIFSTDEPKKTT